MRIGMMVDMYKPHISGITNYVSLNKKILESLGHKVFVFTFGDEDYEDDELYVVRSPTIQINVNETGQPISFRYSRTAQHKVKSMDVVHVHHPFITGPLALRYCKARGIPVVFTNHTNFDLYTQHYLPPYVPDAVAHTFIQTYLPGFCQRCDLTIAPSPGIVTVMRKMGVNSPIKVIPNGIELGPFQNPPRNVTRAHLGLPDDAVVLVYVGRLSPEKNLTFLLRAFLGVAAAKPGSILLVVGDGPEMENLRTQTAQAEMNDRVKFVGKVPYAQIPDYVALADAFVTASETEVHPLSLIEALAAGRPALGIQSPGVGDTIVDGDNGLLSGPDIAAFTAKLMVLATETDARQRMAARARETALAYDINHTAREVLAEYERLAAESEYKMPRWLKFRQQLQKLFPT
jgi:glycosyltransferase involved in cell wall biosynthesis